MYESRTRSTGNQYATTYTQNTINGVKYNVGIYRVWMPLGHAQTVMGYWGKKPLYPLLNPHPCTMSKTSTVSEPGSGFVELTPTWRTDIWGDIAAQIMRSNVAFSAPIQSEYLQTHSGPVVKAYSKAYSPQFDGLTNLGELRETLKMLRNPLAGLQGLVKKFFAKPRRVKRLSPDRYRHYIADQWLEYRYGIMPLIYTAQDLIDMSVYLAMMENAYPVRSGSYFQKPVQRLSVGGPVSAEMSASGYVDITRDVRCGVTLIARSTMDNSWQNVWGLTASDIPSTVWELIPFSFVVDWFSNVGNWIRAITPSNRVKIIASSCSVTTSEIWTVYATSLIAANGKTGRCTSRCIREKKALERRTSIPVPVLPSMDIRFLKNLKRPLDSIALLLKPVERLFRRK